MSRAGWKFEVAGVWPYGRSPNYATDSHDDVPREIEIGRKSLGRGKVYRRVINNKWNVRFVERTMRAVARLEFPHWRFELAENRFGVAEYREFADALGHETKFG